MAFPSAVNMQAVSTIGAAGMALLVIGIRLKAAKKPTSVRKIVIPPLGMTTGYLMFLFPKMHIPWAYALAAVLVGLLFSYPLIKTSNFETIGDDIYLKRSRAFPLFLLGLLAIRIAMHSYVEQYLTIAQTGSAFFILAYGMIVPWRIAMLRKYNKVRREQKKVR
jgi:membrane protein CcdC involved in cytochrome C biogenesis